MKILYHHRTRGTGVEGVHIREMVMGLREAGYEVFVVSPPGVDPLKTGSMESDVRKRSSAGIWKWISASAPQLIFEIFEASYNFTALFKIRSVLKREKIDFIYERYAFFSWAGAYLARRYKVPFILEVNEVSGLKRLRGQLLAGPAKGIEKYVFGNSSAIVTITKFLKGRIEERGIDASKVHVISNAVNLSMFNRALSGKEIRDRYDLNGKTVMGFAGLFSWWDDLPFLIENFARLLKENKGLHLLLIGDAAEEREKIFKLIKAKGIDEHVTQTGRIERPDMPRHVAAMDICVLPHSNPFGSPVVLFEYMAMAKAVVAARVEPIEEIITHGHNGLLFNIHEGESLKGCIQELIIDKEKRVTIGEEAYRTVAARHRWEDNARRVIDIFESVKSRDIPILMYHDIQPDDFDIKSVEPKSTPYVLRISDFDSHMRHLVDNGYNSISLSELPAHIRGEARLPGRPIIITFDDGQASNYNRAFPILKKYGLKGAFFVITGRIARDDMMSWKEIEEMDRYGMEIGSHTLTHPTPTTLPDNELRFELVESKRLLEERLGHKVKFLSSPTGYLNTAISKIAKETGYDGVCIGTFGINKKDTDMHALKRISIKREYTLKTFQSLLSEETPSFTYYKYTQRARAMLRRIMGVRSYEAMRNWMLKRSLKNSVSTSLRGREAAEAIPKSEIASPLRGSQ